MNPLLSREQRQLRRTRVFLKGHLHSSAGYEVVRVRDISRSGALLEAANPPAAESVVHFKFESIRVDARVAWRNGSWFGIEFEGALSADPVESSKAGMQVSAPRSYRSNPSESPADAADGEAIETRNRSSDTPAERTVCKQGNLAQVSSLSHMRTNITRK